MATKRTTPKKRPVPKRHAAHGAHGKRDRYGNPTDLTAYVARLDDPTRDRWQKPDRVVAALALPRGGAAAEIGSGTGAFTIRMAKRVGETGRVYAIDVEPRLLDLLAERAAAAKAWGIVGLLSKDGLAVPPEPVDAVLIVNVLHHVKDRARYLRKLGGSLKPGGRIAIVDFHEYPLPIGPPPDHKLSRADALASLRAAGLALVREETFLPYQYFLLAARTPAG
jgi:SAM-dependent methyltransferase